MAATSQKSSIMRGFNTHFEEMLDDVLSVYPDNLEIITAKNSFLTMKQLNPTAIIKAWHTFVVVPYIGFIENGNIDSFFEKDYSADLAHLAGATSVLQMIDRVREPLKNLGETNMEHIKRYLLNLSKMSIIYNASAV